MANKEVPGVDDYKGPAAGWGERSRRSPRRFADRWLSSTKRTAS
jgi:hypothetical protein